MNKYQLTNKDADLLARGGGGGSSSGGGGSSSGGSSSSGGYVGGTSGSDQNDSYLVWPALIFFAIFLIFYYVIKKYGGQNNAVGAKPEGFIDPFSSKVATPEQKKLATDAKETFMKFQKSWSDFDLKSMKEIASEEYFKKMALELNIIHNYGRQNVMENTKISKVLIFEQDNYSASFAIYFVASAKDRLVDTKAGKDLFVDNSVFAETWHFISSGSGYLLDGIDQSTADASKFDSGIAGFAKSNGFYYDPDFGWLMMPTRGAIFGHAGFGQADINNHVVGYYKNVVVEFYSYQPRAGSGIKPMTVAQAILPKHYDDILVTEKSWYRFKPKQKGLTKINTESNTFNKKFAVWAARPDRATSFELLAPNFMEKIYGLDFEINIEVVDNVLYLYCPDAKINYQQMLEVLSWAFEEMKL
ncbi:DUF3137 domain-containing protein [Candidatus Saccharibacteria bacterium]|nr:DUF3137 domain-containing protein [Candidatus Saccharibacteria bacterium]